MLPFISLQPLEKIKNLLEEKCFRIQANRKINGNNGADCVNARNVIHVSKEDTRKKLNEDILLAFF